MRHHWTIAAVSVLALTAVDGACAVENQKNRHPAAPAAPASAFAPARMIEVRPGVFVSSYDCIIDAGYGRYRRCSDGTK
jgi:hypothetical protein